MIMLRLQPSTIARHWDVISFAIEKTTVAGFDVTEEYLIAMSAKLVSGQVQCWACYEEESNEQGMKIGAFLFTSIVKDALTEVKNLLLAGIYIFNIDGIEVWKQGLAKLSEFALSNECKGISFYTNVPELVKIAKHFGALTSFTYGIISLPNR